jgi:hypothetical protein
VTAGETAPELTAEERVWLQQGARMMLACLTPFEPKESYRVLINQLRLIKDIMPPAVSQAALKRMEKIKLICIDVCKGQAKISERKVAEIAMCNITEVRPEPVKTAKGK